MNLKVGIIAVVALLLLGGGAYWYASSRSTVGTTSEMPVPYSTSGPAQKQSLRDLLALGGAQKCTFATGEASGSATGTVYINGGKIRTDFTSQVADKTVVTHMLVDGTTSYIWMDDSTQGFKMSWDAKTQATAETEAQNIGLDPDKQSDYNCTSETADPAQFVVPANVTFSEFGSVDTSIDKCVACANLTGEAKTQCMSALGCK